MTNPLSALFQKPPDKPDEPLVIRDMTGEPCYIEPTPKRCVDGPCNRACKNK